MPNPTRALAAQDGLCERCEQPVWRQHGGSRGPLPRVHDACLTPLELEAVNRRRRQKRLDAVRRSMAAAPVRTAREAARAKRDMRVLALRAQGLSYPSIAKRLHIGTSTARRVVMRFHDMPTERSA